MKNKQVLEIKVLGVSWNKDTDKIRFECESLFKSLIKILKQKKK